MTILLVPLLVLVIGASTCESTTRAPRSYPSICLHTTDLVYYNDSMTTFRDAKRICNHNGGHLLYFDSTNQYIYVIDFLTNIRTFPAEQTAGLYMGYNGDTKTYTNGLPFTPTFVANKEKMANCEACVVIDMALGLWNCKPCEDKVRFI